MVKATTQELKKLLVRLAIKFTQALGNVVRDLCLGATVCGPARYSLKVGIERVERIVRIVPREGGKVHPWQASRGEDSVQSRVRSHPQLLVLDDKELVTRNVPQAGHQLRIVETAPQKVLGDVGKVGCVWVALASGPFAVRRPREGPHGICNPPVNIAAMFEERMTHFGGLKAVLKAVLVLAFRAERSLNKLVAAGLRTANCRVDVPRLLNLKLFACWAARLQRLSLRSENGVDVWYAFAQELDLAEALTKAVQIRGVHVKTAEKVVAPAMVGAALHGLQLATEHCQLGRSADHLALRSEDHDDAVSRAKGCRAQLFNGRRRVIGLCWVVEDAFTDGLRVFHDREDGDVLLLHSAQFHLQLGPEALDRVAQDHDIEGVGRQPCGHALARHRGGEVGGRGLEGEVLAEMLLWLEVAQQRPGPVLEAAVRIPNVQLLLPRGLELLVQHEVRVQRRGAALLRAHDHDAGGTGGGAGALPHAKGVGQAGIGLCTGCDAA
mmetsp:Transcript_24712/g.78938  ORF Transcript_24712/g.78938 Transcript_24712/m.78938 type:complete len:495 (-) Transcript_24712:171-1655(-)